MLHDRQYEIMVDGSRCPTMRNTRHLRKMTVPDTQLKHKDLEHSVDKDEEQEE